jgi:HlyD family secretion protein
LNAKSRLAQAEAALMGARAHRDLAFKGSRAEELRAAEAELDAARAQARSQSLDHGRSERLVRENAIPVAENDRLAAAADSSLAQVTAAEARLSMLREGTRGELKRVAIADLAAAEAAVEEARAVMSQTRLVAPCDATVVRRFLSEGELVTLMPPATVLSLADMSRFRLRAEVDEEDIANVVEGQPGYATATAFSGQRFPGHVIEKMRDIGRKGVRNEDDPRARVDTRVLEVLIEFDGNVSLPIGLRMDLHLSPSKLAER